MEDLGKSEKELFKPMIITNNSKVKEANTICPKTPSVKSEGETQTNNANYGRTQGLYKEKFMKIELRRHFITIPQTEQDHNKLYEQLKENTRNLKYLLISQEEHADGGQHYHIMITTHKPSTRKSIHKNIMKIQGNIKGSINYQAVDCLMKSETYIKKYGTYLESGEIKTQKYNAKTKDKINEDLHEIYTNDLTTEENLKLIQEKQPAYSTQYSENIKIKLEEKIIEAKPLKKWKIPIYDTKNTTLRPYQKKLWDLISEPPKNRRIIWVCGKPNSGKSFMFNYINENYEYGIYSAGSTASLDNAVYGYNEEGAIAWDIPKNYDYENFGNSLASTIEKFSDFGQTLTSRKYKGKKVKVSGHVIVFSNRTVLDQLRHRDIIEINTNQGMSEKELLETHNAKAKIINGRKRWEVRTEELNETVSRYYTSIDDLPKHIRRDVYE